MARFQLMMRNMQTIFTCVYVNIPAYVYKRHVKRPCLSVIFRIRR